MSLAYSGFLDAARMSEGLVVASWGWYLEMVLKSPESQTTVVPVALSWSREDDMMLALFEPGARRDGQLVESVWVVVGVKR